MEKRDITIQRNLVENALMFLKDFIKKNRPLVLYGAIGALAALMLAIGGFMYYDHRTTAELEKFEELLDQYRSYQGDEQGRTSLYFVTVSELEKVVSSSRWGHVSNAGYYVLGNMSFNEKKYEQARRYYLAQADRRPSSQFSVLALHKAAVASEYLGNHQDALELYKRLERDYATGMLADQLFYDLGRMYQKRSDVFKAREYYHKVITAHPNSPFSLRARQRLLLLSASDKNVK